MNPWFAKAVVLLAGLVMVAIRAPHGQRSRKLPVSRSYRGRLEAALLTFAWAAFFLPLLWIATPWFGFADYELRPVPLLAGTLLFVLGLWLFHRSHQDLGPNWSITLELREQHGLVTEGLYARVRHPMYLALLVYSAGQALVLPNWLAGPSYGVAMALITALRLGPEERMLRERFGAAYDGYAARTRRLIPGIW